MKKSLILLALLLVMGIFAGCSTTSGDTTNQLLENTTLSDVVKAVDDAFNEKHSFEYGSVMMRADIDEKFLTDFSDINMDDVDEFVGMTSMSMTNSDRFIAVKAVEGKAATIEEALLKMKQDLITQYEFYPVSGSLERANSAEVYVKGDYVFFICVGVFEEGEEDAPDFSDDVELAKTTINSMFNN